MATRKNELVDKHNPSWRNLDPSVQALQDDVRGEEDDVRGEEDDAEERKRYARQLALPEITPAHQKRLAAARILMVGAGGLGTPALPLLAGAGIGHITIMDHDTVDETNLHRQTIFRADQIGQNKAECAANYLRALNPEIEITAAAEKFTQMPEGEYDLLLDGSDNFETKSALNTTSIETGTPLISASVDRWHAQVGIFAGFADKPCYHCLFPELPTDACNCNEGGILGSAAALAGTYQAHIALGFLLGLEGFTPGLVLSMDFKTLRTSQMSLNKDDSCAHCSAHNTEWKDKDMNEQPIPLVPPSECRDENTVIVDVRTAGEIAQDPIDGALHIEVSTIPERYKELPKDKRLAFACASNMRSAQAASFVQAMGYEDVVIYDRKAG